MATVGKITPRCTGVASVGETELGYMGAAALAEVGENEYTGAVVDGGKIKLKGTGAAALVAEKELVGAGAATLAAELAAVGEIEGMGAVAGAV